MLSHAQIPVQKSRDSKDPEFSTPGVPGKLGIVKFALSALISNTTLQPNQTKQTPPLIITPHRAGTTEACRFCAEQVVFFFFCLFGVCFSSILLIICVGGDLFFFLALHPLGREKKRWIARGHIAVIAISTGTRTSGALGGVASSDANLHSSRKELNLFQFLLPLTDSTTFCFCGAACAEIPLQGEGRCASQVTKPIIPASFQSI